MARVGVSGWWVVGEPEAEQRRKSETGTCASMHVITSRGVAPLPLRVVVALVACHPVNLHPTACCAREQASEPPASQLGL